MIMTALQHNMLQLREGTTSFQFNFHSVISSLWVN